MIQPLQLSRHRVVVTSSLNISRPSILLVHGIGVSSRYFTRLVNALVPYYDVHAVDLPGYGKAPTPPRPLSIEELADLVHEVCDRLQLKTPTLIGQSMGCQIVANLAHRKPEVMSRLILLGPTVNKAERHLLIQAWHLCQDTFHEPLSVNRIVIADYLRMGFRRYLQTSRSMIADRIEDALADNPVPTLVMSGSRDKIVPKEWGVYLAELPQIGEYALIDGAPHLLQWTHTDEVARRCREFIES
ncbi:MAG: alpha/beta hydrolase [Candidatus Saccharibacteria bacterium]|nr:alpha/beta hydrolase [Candidatus Saccharibacteria bacterium]